MKSKLIALTVLGLGLAAMAPVGARADDWRRDGDGRERVEWRRHEIIRHERWVEPIPMREVPERVRDRVEDYRHGRHIESIGLVHDGGAHYYSFRIHGRYTDFYLEIAPDGRVIRRINV